MEWFWRLLEHFEKSIAFSVLQSFSPLDWACLFAILWGMLQGSRKGFSDMFGKLSGIFLISMLTLSFYKGVAAFLIANLSALSEGTAEAFAFVSLSIFLWLSVSWCVNSIGKILRVEAHGLLKALGGMVFGGVRMLLLISFLMQLLMFGLPIKPVWKIFQPGHSRIGYKVSQVMPQLHKLVFSFFPKSVSKRSVELHKAGG